VNAILLLFYYFFSIFNLRCRFYVLQCPRVLYVCMCWQTIQMNDMFRIHTPIIRSIGCWVAAYGFRHRVIGWVVVLRAAAQVVLYDADGAVQHDLRSASQDHHPSKNSVQKTICCNSTSNAPDDGRLARQHPLLVSLEFFIDIKSFRSHYGPGVDSVSNRNEYQEHFLGVKAAGA